MYGSICITLSAIIIFALGVLHLIYTFRGDKLHPRDAALQSAMAAGSPVISRETTMWRAWIGFNASHSFGAMLFGLIYGYLAVFHGAFLFQSWFLLGLGLLLLLGYIAFGWVCWFSAPFRGISLATLFYASGLVLNFA
jgi:hypothetical protein